VSFDRERQVVRPRVDAITRKLERLGDHAGGVALRLMLEAELVLLWLDAHRAGIARGRELERSGRHSMPPAIPIEARKPAAVDKTTPVHPIDWIDPRARR